MAHRVDHAAHFRCILKRRAAMALVQTKADQRLALFVRAAAAGIMPERFSGTSTNLDDTAVQSLATARKLLLEHGVLV
jgi:hypothetical protein